MYLPLFLCCLYYSTRVQSCQGFCEKSFSSSCTRFCLIFCARCIKYKIRAGQVHGRRGRTFVRFETPKKPDISVRLFGKLFNQKGVEEQVVRLVGLEPTTPKLKVSCATNCATVANRCEQWESNPHVAVANLARRFHPKNLLLAYFPSLRPHALSRDRRCLWSTDLYSGWASYTTLWSRLFRLSASAESDLITPLVGGRCPSQHLYYSTLDKVCQEVFYKIVK